MATNNGDLLTPELEAEIQSLAREENRAPSKVLEAALKAYRLQRLAAYGQTKARELGLRPPWCSTTQTTFKPQPARRS